MGHICQSLSEHDRQMLDFWCTYILGNFIVFKESNGLNYRETLYRHVESVQPTTAIRGHLFIRV